MIGITEPDGGFSTGMENTSFPRLIECPDAMSHGLKSYRNRLAMKGIKAIPCLLCFEMRSRSDKDKVGGFGVLGKYT